MNDFLGSKFLERVLREYTGIQEASFLSPQTLDRPSASWIRAGTVPVDPYSQKVDLHHLKGNLADPSRASRVVDSFFEELDDYGKKGTVFFFAGTSGLCEAFWSWRLP
jgi:hypothetical protein